jgi:hypothetical protein
MSRSVALAGGAIIAIVVGCHEASTAISPENEASRQRVEVTPGDFAAVGCAVATAQTNGQVAVTRIPRALLPFSLPSLVAPKKQAGPTAMFVVATQLAMVDHGTSHIVGISCLMPSNDDGRGLTALLNREGPGTWARLSAHLEHVDSTFTRGTPLPIAASRSLLAPLRSKMTTHIRQSHKVAGTATEGPANDVRRDIIKLASYNGSETPDYSRGAPVYSGRTPVHFAQACQPYCVGSQGELPDVRVMGTGNTWTYDFSEMWWFFHSTPSYGGGYNLDYDFTGCADASVKWINDKEELDSLVADSVDYAESLNGAVQNYVCVPQNNSKKTCLDIFISAKKFFVIGYGDGRDTDPNAKYWQSRVQVYFDFDNLTYTAYVNGSRIGFDWMSFRSAPYPHNAKAVTMTPQSDGTVVVTWEFYNGYCVWPQAAAMLYPTVREIGGTCPSIDGAARFQKQSDGTWIPISVQNDQFPSTDVFLERPDGSFQRQASYPEVTYPILPGAAALWTRHETLEKWRQELAKPLPNGCQLE